MKYKLLHNEQDQTIYTVAARSLFSNEAVTSIEYPPPH
jgi:hypothetical protein